VDDLARFFSVEKFALFSEIMSGFRKLIGLGRAPPVELYGRASKLKKSWRHGDDLMKRVISSIFTLCPRSYSITARLHLALVAFKALLAAANEV
jgi:hypothetical protein